MSGSTPGGIELTPNGLKFQRTWRAIPMMGGGKRGTIHGFSRAAARRLKETLFRCDFRAPGMFVVGVCLTLPREAAPGVGETVWKQIHRKQARIPSLVSLVWRKELQMNGREHYHAILWSDDPDTLKSVGTLVRMWCRLVAMRCPQPDRVERRMIWSHCRGNEKSFDVAPPPLSGEDIAAQAQFWREEYLTQLVDSCPCLTPIDGQGRGVRYLIDHASQHKSYQALTTGRAWGIWHRARLPKIPPGASLLSRLTRSEEYALARLLRHLSRYRRSAPCVFGWKWHPGRRFARGSHIIPSALTRDVVRRWLEYYGVIGPILEDIGA